MRWLHLSDLHFGRDNSAQKTAIASLVAAVGKFAKNREFDLILLTGDLAYSGHQEEYKNFEMLLLGPIRDLSSFSGAKIVMVPGNHDLDCSAATPIVWERLGSGRQQEFFSRSDAGRRLRQHRAQAFLQYELFAARCGAATCVPSLLPATKISITNKNGQRVEFVCINTAFFSDKEVDDKNIAPAPVDALREVFSDLDTTFPVFVLGHHPIHWFSRESAHHFKTLLIEKNATYLHGHLHEIEPLFGQKGLVSLGFGAVYQANLAAPSKPYYRNSFAICELDDVLRVEWISWDSDFGSWVPETRLPADMHTSYSKEIGSCSIRLPSSSIGGSFKGNSSPRQKLFADVSIKPRVEPPMWLDADPKGGWVNLLTQIGELRGVERVASIGLNDGSSTQFVVTDASGSHLVRALAAASATITYAQIEQTNTLLDTESLTSCILVTLGTLADEAETLAARLKEKKALSVITGGDLAVRATRLAVIEQIRSNAIFDVEAVTLTPIISPDGIAVLVLDAEKQAWFCIVATNGHVLNESADLVYKVRIALPELRDTAYSSIGRSSGLHIPSDPPFDRSSYLRHSLSLFDTVKYAGLAALGFRMPADSLRQLYVPAAADVAANIASHQALKAAVDDFIEALNLDAAQRDQVEMQLRNYYGLNKSAETGAASGLYQKYGSVLVVGDPGSGKSCFVRSEILAYSVPSSDGDWYSKHTPVFLSLADAARISKDGDDLLDVCVRFASSQRFELSRKQLDVLLAKGEVAFFFDGVDEVGSLDVRQNLLKQISGLMDAQEKHGNRFVVTSRPAAVNTTDVPDDLVRIRLRGLTNSEIEVLATRIMSIDPSTGTMVGELRRDQRDVVEQLVRDCEDKPGIRRLARNPLLLTLLVLIYANSGALEARRHIVYSQAIRTLVSVRHRSSKTHLLSEADLRRRLGTLALCVYRGIVSEIPARREVREVLAPEFRMSPSEGRDADVDRFVQEVAEATGLVVIHPRSESHEDDVISFMHHSFMEYYAAVGFMAEPDYKQSAPEVALRPRWREVVTLMFGLLGEQGDISAFLGEISRDRDPADRITASRLSMVLDCALECDVPPNRAQELVGDLLFRSLTDGPGSVVADARASLAVKVQELLQNTGSISIRNRLITGMQSDDPRVAAAHVDFVARMAQVLSSSVEFREGVTNAFQSRHEIVRIACISALQAVPMLRDESNLARLKVSLERGSAPERRAALQLLDFEPALVPRFSSIVLECMNDRSNLVSNLAARCVIVSGIFAQDGYENRGLLGKALSIYTQADAPLKQLDKYIDLSSDKLEQLIYSESLEDQRLGIRCLVAIKREPAAIHGYLFSVLRRSTHHGIRTACLESMAADLRIIRVASLADAELVCNCVEDDHIDVRRSAAKALRHFPAIDFVHEVLRRRYEALRSSGDESERREVIRALAAHGVHEKGIRNFLQVELESTLMQSSQGWGEKRRSLMARLLQACDQMAGVLSARIAGLLYDTATDFRTPQDIRRLAIRVFGRTCFPSIENCNKILALLERPQRSERLSAYKAAGSFIDRCKGDVSTVRTVRSVVGKLRAGLIRKWDSEFGISKDRIDVSGLRDIRVALLSIEDMLSSYDEFSSRMKASEVERQAKLDLE